MSEGLLAAVIETVPGLIVATDAEGRITLFNRACEALTGYTQEEVLGERLIELLVPADWVPTVEARFADPTAEAVRLPHLNPWRTRSGEQRLIEWRCTLLAGPNPGVLGVGVDITDREAAHASMARLNARLQALYDASPDIIFVHAPDGHLLDANRNAEARFGYSREEMLARPFSDLCGQHPRYGIERAREYIAAALSGETIEFEWVARDARGREFPVEVRLRRLAGPDDQAAVLAVVRDVTERKRAHERLQRSYDELSEAHRRLRAMQAQLLQAEKMASVGLLAAGVAHEINNPVGYVSANLGTLQGYLADLFRLIEACELLENAAAGSPEQGRVQALKEAIGLEFLRRDVPELLRESEEGIARVKGIVQDLRNFSRIGEEVWERADLHRGLDSTLNIISNELRYKAEVVKRYGRLPEVECIPARLDQVFMNLLMNAVQSLREPGTITLTTSARGGWVQVSIADTGEGIAAQDLPRIFDPFFTTKPMGEGTGLGLSLSYGIVQQHGGEITVQSRPGEGTCFTVRLPCRRAAASPAQR